MYTQLLDHIFTHVYTNYDLCIPLLGSMGMVLSLASAGNSCSKVLCDGIYNNIMYVKTHRQLKTKQQTEYVALYYAQ